jgi:F-type H+-transporting ATPase subunit epsilon
MALELVVVTPEGEAFAEPVDQVVLPGAEGDFGVLESHEKFLAPLKPGPMEIKLAGGRSEWAAVSDGFAEVSSTRVVVLVDECSKADEIDIEHARTTVDETERALQEIADTPEEADRRARLESALVRANVLIDVYTRHHG